MLRLIICLMLASTPAYAHDALSLIGESDEAVVTHTQPAREIIFKQSRIFHISLHGESDYGGTYLVDETGILNLPLIGDIDTRCKNLHLITDEIRKRLADGFFVDPQPQVSVTGHAHK